MYENCPKRYYHQRVTKEVSDSGSEATRYGERVHRALEERLLNDNVLSKETIQYEALCNSISKMKEHPDFSELLLEEKLTVTEDFTPTGWWSDDAWLRSILDVLVLFKDKAIVMDWKTGKRRPDFTQLEMFALQVFSHFPHINRVTTSFVWLKDMKQDKRSYCRELSYEMQVDLNGRIDRINKSLENDDFPAKPSGLCRWCPCYEWCDYAS
jgi:CRISPR/Cas system-associated exonuclease Cas4 (RecB family)